MHADHLQAAIQCRQISKLVSKDSTEAIGDFARGCFIERPQPLAVVVHPSPEVHCSFRGALFTDGGAPFIQFGEGEIFQHQAARGIVIPSWELLGSGTGGGGDGIGDCF